MDNKVGPNGAGTRTLLEAAGASAGVAALSLIVRLVFFGDFSIIEVLIGECVVLFGPLGNDPGLLLNAAIVVAEVGLSAIAGVAIAAFLRPLRFGRSSVCWVTIGCSAGVQVLGGFLPIFITI